MFKTLVRTTGPFGEAGQLFVTLFKEFGWTLGGILFVDRGKPFKDADLLFIRITYTYDTKKYIVHSCFHNNEVMNTN